MVLQVLPVAIPSINLNDIATDTNDTGNFTEIPLTQLGPNTRRLLSDRLNKKKILRSEEGYERDWRGMATLAQVKSFCNETSNDPMTILIEVWCKQNPQTATFANLDQFLGIIDRWDVSDDIYENLVADAKKYTTLARQKSLNDDTDSTNTKDTLNDCDFDTSRDILTNDDVARAQMSLPPQQYDAFVLFSDADINYAMEIHNKFENDKYNLKLCFKDRDVLPGSQFTHKTLMQLIEERCNHLLVILTNEFLKSPQKQFLVDYTQMLQIEENKRKIIPLVYDRAVMIPRSLKIYTHLNYHANSSLYDFWNRLANAITDVGVKDNCSLTLSQQSTPDSTSISSAPFPSTASTTPSPTSPIPSININGQAYIPDDEQIKSKNSFIRNKFLNSRPAVRQLSTKSNIETNGFAIRNAHSTSQLNTGYIDTNISMPDLHGSTEVKKKKKRPIKQVLKRVFSRSSPKLQEAD